MHYEERRIRRRRNSAQMALCNTNNCLVSSSGALQIVVGIVSVVFGIVVLLEEYDTDKNPVAMPVWAGGWYLLTGIIGLTTICIRSRALMTTYLVMSLIAAILAVAQIIWESIAYTIHKDEYEKCDYPFDGSSFDCFNRLAEYMHLASAVIAGIEIMVATFGWVSAICRGGCNCTPEERVIEIPRPPPPRRSYYIDTSKIFIK